MKTTRLSSNLVEGLALLVALLGALWFVTQSRGQRHNGHAEALADLLATSHTPRMIANPGVEAWLLGLLRAAGAELPERQREAYDRLLYNADGPLPTPDMRAVAEQLRARPEPTNTPKLEERVPMELHSVHLAPIRAFQEQRVGKRTLVITRRQSLVAAKDTPPELDLAAEHIGAIAERWDDEAMTLEGASPLISGPLRAARVYVVLEDGSYLSLPLAEADEEARALEREREQLQARPRSPSLGSNSLFTRFDYGSPLEDQAHFTGIYPDLAGAGFVASLAVPVLLQKDGLRAAVVVDLVVDIDLDRLLAVAIPELELELTGSLEPVHNPMWHPWSALASALPPDARATLRREVQLQANREADEGATVPRAPVAHHRSVHGRGVLFALQVQEQRWLVGWISKEEGPSPWLPAGLTPVLVLGLVLWGRRLRQREDALDLLDLPLVVVDPDDDAVVSCNAAASKLGVVEGHVFKDHVIAAGSPEQDYYKSQQVSGGRRRAYGIHLRLGLDEPGARGRPPFALIRSVSLREPALWLGASASHRLGMICVVNHDADFALYLDEIVDEARREERNKLAALINHGADTLARVLARRLPEGPDGSDPAFTRWLAEYLLRRLDVSQWVLDHWDGPVIGEIQSGPRPRARRPRILGPENLRLALQQYERIFAAVAKDDGLRAQLHWNNGTLAASSPSGSVLSKEVDWPKEYRLTVPADGLFGYLLGEALINAVKHGAPGMAIELEVDLDRSRRELSFVLRNYLLEAPATTKPKTYGGLEIITELARLCGWPLTHKTDRDSLSFELRWSCPVTLQVDAEQVD